MNAIKELPAFTAGQALEGGFFAGLINIDGKTIALIASPRAEGEINEQWLKDYTSVPGAMSLNDGVANTKAMLEAGSPLAKAATELTINGFNDWYIPSVDEAEVAYRTLKPYDNKDSVYYRSGINLHAVPPTLPYTHQPAVQTSAQEFQAGGSEAYGPYYYWTSTQRGDSDYAFAQDFEYGSQFGSLKNGSLRARVFRRLEL